MPRASQADQEAVGRRIGRRLGKHLAAAAIVVTNVIHGVGGRALGRVSSKGAGQKSAPAKGRGDRSGLVVEVVCPAHAAFRTAKSDLGLRPVFHQKEDRMQAHILVRFTALELWPSLEQWTQAKGLGTCARQLVKDVATIKSVDVLLPVLRGEVRAELRLRVVATPEPATARLLALLGLRLPKGPRIVTNVVPKAAL